VWLSPFRKTIGWSRLDPPSVPDGDRGPRCRRVR
jgi:hypothetical protein